MIWLTLYVPYLCITEYAHTYVTNQQMHISKMFPHILLFIGIFRSFLQQSSGCRTNTQTLYKQLHRRPNWNYPITYSLTYCMEQSPSWEANWFSSSQEIPPILWNPKFHYRIQKCPPPLPILNQLGAVHTPSSYFLKIHLNIILPSTPGSPKWSLSLRFLHQNPLYASPLPHKRYMPRPSHSSRFYHPNIIGWGLQIIKLLIILLQCKPTNANS